MKKQIFFFLCLFTLGSQGLNGQTNQSASELLSEAFKKEQEKAKYKLLLDEYCEEYFENCFYWKYYEIVNIEDVDDISSNKVKITGKVKNGSFFGTPVIRDFIVEIKTYDEKIVIYFKKNGDTGWKDCKQSFVR